MDTTTLSTIEQLYNIVDFLAGNCDGAAAKDGQGFNKFDTDFGHKMAEVMPAKWSFKQANAAWHLIQKYAGQVTAGLGIEVSQIPQPRPEDFPPAPTTKDVRVIDFVDGRFLITFSYNPALVEAIRSVPGRRWDKEQKQWHVPTELGAMTALRTFSEAQAFDVSDQALAELSTRLQTAKEMTAISSAHDADLEVQGLGGTLLPFQKAGVAYVVKAKRVLIADEPGLGKTVEALASIQATGGYRAVVVCPASLKLNWRKEVLKWLPGRTVHILDGRALAPTSFYEADIVIVNYEVLASHVEKLLQVGFRTLIADESHYLKASKTMRSKAVMALRKGAEYVLLLTGTPVLNRPLELASQLAVLDRLDDLGGFWKFVHRYCDAQHTGFGWDFSGASNLGELNERLRACCFVRREKKDVLTELPAKRRTVVPLEIENRKEYERAKADIVSWVGERAASDSEFRASLRGLTKEEAKVRQAERMAEAETKAERAEQLVRIEALKQLCVQGKMKAVAEWVTEFLESGQKLVLFAQHIAVQKELLNRFPEAARLLGEDSGEVRDRNVTRFQTEAGCRLMVVSLQAGGLGLTLTAASNVAFIELGWTPAIHDQAEDRLHRIGQQDSVTAWYLLAGQTIEEEIADLIDKKRAVVTAATVGGEATEAGMLTTLLRELRKSAEVIE